MAQTYTLEEAADHLNLSVEEFKRRLRTEWTQVRSFRDGATLRFRANEIDELARSIGLGSSEELPLADAGAGSLPEEIGLAKDADAPKTPAPTKKQPTDADAPLQLNDSDEVFHLTPDSGKQLKPKGDSDVRLEKAGKRSGEEESILTEELQAPAAGGSGKLSGKSGKLSSAKLKSGGDSGKAKAGDSGKKLPSQPAEEDSSEFELSLDADSDEFELSLTQDSSEEVPLGEMPAESKSKTGKSGINLARPADSGVSLEKRKKADDEEVDFELSLDAPGSGKSSQKFTSGSGVKKSSQPDSDSEFELTLEEPSDLSPGSKETPAAAGDKKQDIFEATDFEIPALEDDSASEVVSLEESDTDLESSDFDLALDEADASAEGESGSEVVALDEGKGKGRRKKKKADDDDEGVVEFDSDLEEGPSASKALRGVRADEDEEDYEVSESAEEDEEGRPVAVAGPAQWGALPAILMLPTVIILFLGSLMAYELLHSVWGYQQGTTPATPLVSFFADTAGAKPAQ
ncbi:MAG TPA: hypothetical protein VKD90_11110 [Gemmataceae bacterium]|nr:hypothetical protein [Gemmataceae bacterium]